MLELQPAKMKFSESSERERDWVELTQLAAPSAAGASNFDVFGEAGCIKQESRHFDCDAGSDLELSTEAAGRKEMLSVLAGNLRKEIEEANVERVFIDLARAEAEREYTEIEAQRDAEAARFHRKLEIASSKIRSLSEELLAAKELEAELAATYQDLNALQNEMEYIKLMERSCENKRSLSGTLELAPSQAESEAARKELLLSLREEGFKLMAEMDNIRGESTKIAEAREQSAESERRRKAHLRSLSSNLHKAVSKLESAASAEKRAGAIVANLSAALQQLRSDAAVAKREAELTNEEASAVREETAEMCSAAKLCEERLRDAAEELDAVKESEAAALEQLQALTESIMRERAIAALFCPTITLSAFEYQYLIKQGRSAQEVADKKVAAAEAWIEAIIQAGEEEQQAHSPPKAAETARNRRAGFVRRREDKRKKADDLKKARSSRERDLQERDQLAEPLKPKLAIAMPRRSITLGRGRGGLAAAAQPRRSTSLGGESRTARKARRSSSLAPTRRRGTTQQPQPAASASRRKKVVHRLVNFFSRSAGKNLGGQCILLGA